MWRSRTQWILFSFSKESSTLHFIVNAKSANVVGIFIAYLNLLQQHLTDIGQHPLFKRSKWSLRSNISFSKDLFFFYLRIFVKLFTKLLHFKYDATHLNAVLFFIPNSNSPCLCGNRNVTLWLGSDEVWPIQGPSSNNITKLRPVINVYTEANKFG